MQVTIHLARIGKPPRTFTEGLVEDDGRRLRTCSHLPQPFATGWSQEWQRQGMLDEGQTIAIVRKYHFYQEYFGVMALYTAADDLLGYYCDIATPLQKIDREYYLTDLILDLWVPASGPAIGLDLEEFAAAAQSRLLSHEMEMIAGNVFAHLNAEAAAGRFPGRYIE